jgi:nitroimidazol reductase NimA-like FMN-containing flavoprotein (pyridoxamine 5'-phosphate oxidase superfamily)
MSRLERTARTTLKRLPERGSFDRAVADAILDEALVCHLGFVVDGQPFVIPTIHARMGDAVYVHGSAASRALRTVKGGLPVCLTVTLLDGLVLARSAFHHSMNYRSVLLLGPAFEVTDDGEKHEALKAIVEHVSPGRWDHVRAPNEGELKATSVVRIAIDEGSAKVRTGPPKDDDADYALPIWAGVLPLRLLAGAPVADPKLPVDVPLPEHVARYTRPGW